MILLPAVDIRDGKAVRLRQGHFDEETVYADDPLEAARSFVEAGARFLHVVDLDGAREGEPVNLAPRRADHARARRAGASSAAACARSPRSGARSAPAPTAWCSARRPSPTRTCSTRRSRRSPRASWWGWTCAAGRCRWPAGRARRRCAARTRSGACSGAAPRASSTPTSTATGCSRAPTSTRSRRVSAGGARALPLLGRDRLARRPAGAARAAAVNLAGVISGKALYEGRFGVREGQAALEDATDAAAPGHPLPRRGQGPRGQGRRVREPARRRRPGRAGRALPGRGRRRDRLPRHHRLAREARDRRRSSRAAAPTTCSSRSRSAAACARSRTPRRCSTPAPTRCR